jgi:N-acetylmuramoyl-L-alanine amidase
MPQPDWCPFATRTPSPNFTPGNDPTFGRDGAVAAIVLHISEGALTSSLPWLRNPVSKVSSTFFIAKNGTIYQLVPLSGVPWTNGLSWDSLHQRWLTPAEVPRPVVPLWTDIRRGINPNRYTLSIEHEGHSGEPLTPAMRGALLRLLGWLRDTLGWSRYTAGRT